MFYVYPVQSEDYPDQRYIGLTTDLKRHLAGHNAGKSFGRAPTRPRRRRSSFRPFRPFRRSFGGPWTSRLPAECGMQAADDERAATFEVSMLVNMMPILCPRVSARIRHNIAQFCQEPSVIAGQNNTCVPA